MEQTLLQIKAAITNWGITFIYLGDMLLMGRTLPEILMATDILIFLLQHLGFVINLKKSVLHPVKQMEFLGLVTDAEIMTLALSEKKIKACASTISGGFYATTNFSFESH